MLWTVWRRQRLRTNSFVKNWTLQPKRLTTWIGIRNVTTWSSMDCRPLPKRKPRPRPLRTRLSPPSRLLTRRKLSSDLFVTRLTCRWHQMIFLLHIVSWGNPDSIPAAVQLVRRLLYILPTSRRMMPYKLPGGRWRSTPRIISTSTKIWSRTQQTYIASPGAVSQRRPCPVHGRISVTSTRRSLVKVLPGRRMWQLNPSWTVFNAVLIMSISLKFEPLQFSWFYILYFISLSYHG